MVYSILERGMQITNIYFATIFYTSVYWSSSAQMYTFFCLKKSLSFYGILYVCMWKEGRFFSFEKGIVHKESQKNFKPLNLNLWWKFNGNCSRPGRPPTSQRRPPKMCIPSHSISQSSDLTASTDLKHQRLTIKIIPLQA